jgi:LCP family protein required for cell wall assembly
MTKKIFLAFTIIMVLITGTIFYMIISKAKYKQEERMKRIEVKLPDLIPSLTPPVSLPDAVSINDEEQPQLKKATTLTQNQKYYTSLVPPNSTNVLLIGKDPTYSNFDKMVIVSIDEENKTVRVIDLPRDIYVDYSDHLLKQIHEADNGFFKEKGSRKLNAAHVIGNKINYSPDNQRFSGRPNINFLADLIYEIFDIDIKDYVSIETDGFRELVDYFGGVVVDVPYYMHYEDPTQDLYIHLEPGLQVLNGKQAEEFVRFRQGYTRDGRLVSYSRTDNTFLFLKSFYKQHVTLRNLQKIGKVYEIVRENTKTSVQHISTAYQYARLFKEVLENDYSIESVNIKCIGTKEVEGALYDIIRTK